MQDANNMSLEQLRAAAQEDIQNNGVSPKISGESTGEDVKTPELPEKSNVDGDDTSKPEDKGEDQEEHDPYEKRIARMTKQKHRLAEEKEKLAEENKAKNDEIAKLNERLAALEKGGAKPEEQDENEDEEGLGDEKPTFKPEDIHTLINKALEEREAANRMSAADKAELEQLFEKNPNAKKRKGELEQLSKKHPTLSYEALDTLLAPHEYADEVELNRKKANRMSSNGRSRADLANDKDPSKMSLEELRAEAYKLAERGEF